MQVAEKCKQVEEAAEGDNSRTFSVNLNVVYWAFKKCDVHRWSGKGNACKFCSCIHCEWQWNRLCELIHRLYDMISPIFSLQKREMWSIAYCFVFGLGLESMILAFYFQYFLSLRCRFQEVLPNHIISPYFCSTTKAVSSESFVALCLKQRSGFKLRLYVKALKTILWEHPLLIPKCRMISWISPAAVCEFLGSRTPRRWLRHLASKPGCRKIPQTFLTMRFPWSWFCKAAWLSGWWEEPWCFDP